MPLRANIKARAEAPGISVDVVDYRWSRGESIYELHPDFLIRRRASPTNIGVTAIVEGGLELPFGDLMFFPANVPVQTMVATRDIVSQTITCRFEPSWLSRYSVLPEEWDAITLRHCFDLHNSRIASAVDWMGKEALLPGFASTIYLESLSTMIATEAARHFIGSVEKRRVRTREGKIPPAYLNRIIDYIDSVTEQCPSIAEIAAACDISGAHLRRAFKSTTGQTIHKYVEEIRFQRAKSLLAETDLPLKAISHRLGFAASSSFSSVFRNMQGETPSEFRIRSRA